MKLKSNGSVQCRKSTGGYYFVTRNNFGKQIRVPLKTKDPDEAMKRAEILAGTPSPGCERVKWLEYLVGVGKKAEAEIAGAVRADVSAGLNWESLFDLWREKADEITDNYETLRRYEGQVRTLSKWFGPLGITPGALDRSSAQVYLKSRPAASQKKDLMLFRRMWRDLGLTDDVWNKLVKDRAVSVPYRRLQVAEVEAVCRLFLSGVEKPSKRGEWKRLPVYSDLIQIGYYTGLRRKNVVLLNADNVAPGGDFIEVFAFKGKHLDKKIELRIPLLKPARNIVARRLECADEQGFLFPELLGASMGKALALGFKRAGVEQKELGKASFHSLRTTFISLMDDGEVQGYLTDAITGHKREKGMHGHYSYPARAKLMEAVERSVPVLDLSGGK